MIRRLPQHVINKLKAGEIVERPASVLKELLENALDAGATRIDVVVEEGGKKLIKVTDTGSGISAEDLPLTIERYATSKIVDERDLEDIHTYGFRGEALASISEVSTFRLQSKQQDSPVGYELRRDGERFVTKQIPYAQDHGTTIIIQDIFHDLPAREKFLKSDVTERQYIQKLFIEYVLAHTSVHWTLSKDGKQLWNLSPAASLLERVLQVTKAEWEGNLKPLAYQDEQTQIRGVVGDANLHFTTSQYMHLFVNQRPVEDKLIKKALMQAYERQLVPGTMPFAVVFVQIDPTQVDVNVHPRKQEVKFLDPGSVFTLVESTVREAIGEMKVNYAAFRKPHVQHLSVTQGPFGSSGGAWSATRDDRAVLSSAGSASDAMIGTGSALPLQISHRFSTHSGGSPTQEGLFLDHEPVTLLGQLWNMYLVLEGQEYLYLIDQHALAERIIFEKMKQRIQEEGFTTQVLLQPLILSVPADIELDPLITSLLPLGFDLSDFGNGKLIIHALPRIFQDYQVDIGAMFNQLRGAPEVSFDLILDAITGTKACKAAIKAGQPLHHQEMIQLIQDGSSYIPGMFVCQHGRPSVVKLPREHIDELFDR